MSLQSTGSVGASSDGITVNAYGQGQCSGVTYTVPAHGEIDVAFNIKMMVVTPADIESLDKLILGMLDASKQEKYTDLKKQSSSGGSCFFGLWNHSTHSSSETQSLMKSWGLSQANQDKIINKMLKISGTMNKFDYSGKISNTKYDYSVSGNMFAIVMDCTIQKGESHQQLRFIAPDVHMSNDDGDNLPSTGKLY